MRQIYISILLIIFSANNGFSQKDTLIFKYRRLALEYQQDVKKAKKGLEGANSLVDAAKAGFLPKIDVTGNYNFFANPMQLGQTNENPGGTEIDNKYQVGLWLSQPIFTGGFLRNTKNIALSRSDIASSFIELIEQNTMFEADGNYLNVVAKKEVNLLAIAYRDAIKEFLDVIQDRVDEEIVGMNELYQTKVRFNDAQYEVIRKEKEYKVSLMGLNRLIGISLETESLHSDSLYVVVWSESAESGIEKAIQLRPEISIKESEIMKNQYVEKVSASNYNPKMDIGIGGVYGAPSPGLSNDPAPNLLVSANLAIPIFYWGQKNDKVFARQKITEQTQLDLDKTHDIIELQVTSGYYELKQSQEQVTFAFSSLDNAKKNVDVMIDRYQEGLSSVLEVLDAQLFWQKSYLNYIEAKFELNTAFSHYQKAMGTLSISQ